MLVLFNFVIAIVILFIPEYSKADYEVIVRSNLRDQCFGLDHVYLKNRVTKEFEFEYCLNEDLIYYTNPGTGPNEIDFCMKLDTNSHECALDVRMWTRVIFDNYLPSLNYTGKWFLKFDIVAVEPITIPQDTSFFYPDVFTFNFPAFSMYYPNEEHLKVMFLFDPSDADHRFEYSRYLYFEDPEDKCRAYRPTAVDDKDLLNLNLFLNRKWTEHAYYFIKKDNFVCGYTILYTDLFKETNYDETRIYPVGFNLIENYPTENYAPNFLCIDALYGTFVSLYWNQQEADSLPEAHYYIINENDIKNIQLIDRLVLKDFDQNVLKDIFDNVFDNQYFPTFTSYGRTIFIWFKRQNESQAFNGFWKNETAYDVHFENVASRTQRKLFRAKREYIQVDRPVGRKDVTATPPPITLYPPTTTTESTTTTLSTSTLPTSTSSSTTFSSSEQSTYSSIETSTFSDTVSPEGNKDVPEGNNAELTDKKDYDCQYETYLWILIALICIDAIFGIILGILIFLKFRGAKKLKAARAKRYAKQNASVKLSKKRKQTSSKPSVMLKEKKFIIKRKPKPPKKSTTKEKSVTTKTEDAGGKTTTEANKTTTTVDKTTSYYTVNENFDKK